jgi:hypothetical protein
LRSTSDRDSFRRELVARARQGASDVRRLTAGLSDEELGTRTVAAAWSPIELVIHLAQVQHLIESRIDAMLAEECPGFAAYAPDDDAEFRAIVDRKPGIDAVSAFLTGRERFVERLDALTPSQWSRTGSHPTFGIFDVEFLVDYMLQHEAHHVYQLFMRRVPLVRRVAPC